MMVELKDIIKKGTIVLFINVIAAFMVYLTRILIARSMSVYEVGLFYGVYNFIVFFTFLRSWGLDAGLSKYIAEFKAKGENDKIKTVIASAAISQIVFSLVIIIVMILFSNFLVKNYFHDENTKILLIVLCWVLLSNAASNVFKGIFRGFKHMLNFALVELIDAVYILAVLFIFTVSLKSLMFAYVSTGVIIFIFGIVNLKKIWEYRKHKIVDYWHHTKLLFKLGIPLMLAGFGGMIISYIDTLMIVYFRPMEEVGIYNMILPFAVVFLYFAKAGFSAIIPSVSETHAMNHHYKIKDFIKKVYKLLPLILIPLLIFMWKADFFLKLFFGEAYLPGTLPLRILLVGVFFYMITIFNSEILVGIGNTLPITFIVLTGAVANVIINFLLIPKYGMIGAAIATSASYILTCIISLFVIKKEINHEKYIKKIEQSVG